MECGHYSTGVLISVEGVEVEEWKGERVEEFEVEGGARSGRERVEEWRGWKWWKGGGLEEEEEGGGMEGGGGERVGEWKGERVEMVEGWRVGRARGWRGVEGGRVEGCNWW